MVREVFRSLVRLARESLHGVTIRETGDSGGQKNISKRGLGS